MKLMSPLNRLSIVFPALLLLVLTFSTAPAQSRKSANSKKPVAKKTERAAKDARKDSKKSSKKEKLATNSKNTKKSAKEKAKERATLQNSRKDNKRDDRKLSAKEKKRLAELDKKDAKKSKETRKEREARRLAEEERRQAILAEQRRREQAAREARERRLAFERGLRTETIANISNDDTEGEDLQVRRAAVNALGNRAGTVVVMETQTGKIMTIVNQDWAIRNSFKPCSTIKLVTGVAGVSEQVINKEGGIGESNGGLDLNMALARSKNGYFQRVGSNLGNSKMIFYARQLGLGEPTGINADGETPGRLANGNNSARIYSHGDDFEVTPLQLAVMTTAISNGGKRVVPQIARTGVENASFRTKFNRPVSIASSNLDEMLPGMLGTAEYGTARRGVDASLGIAGKTGSCVYKGTWIGLFTSVAPVENPKYAVVVITRGQSERGKYAAAVAGRIYDELAPRMRQFQNENLRYARFKQDVKVDKNNVAAADEDEDDSENTESESGNSDIIVAGANQNRSAFAAKQVQKPLVTKIVKSQPKFPPVVITFSKDEANGVQQSPKQRPRVIKNR